MAQLAEAGGLNPPRYGFKSHWGHPEKCYLTRHYSDIGIFLKRIRALIGPLRYGSAGGLLADRSCKWTRRPRADQVRDRLRPGSVSAGTGRADPVLPSIVGRTTLFVCDRIGRWKPGSPARPASTSSRAVASGKPSPPQHSLRWTATWRCTSAPTHVVWWSSSESSATIGARVSRSYTQCRKDGEDEHQ